MTDTHEAIGKDVEEEAADELLGVERLGFEPISVFSVPVAEGDLTVLHRQDTVVGDRYPVGVAAQVIEDLLWGSERFFRIDDPILVAEPRSWGWEFSLSDGLAHQVEELTPEDSAQVLEREGACGDEAVEVEVVFEELVPGMEHGDKAQFSPQVSAAKLQ